MNPVNWDFKKNKPKVNCPNKEHINKIIIDKLNELSEQIVQLKSERKEFTANSLISETSKKVQPRTVGDMFLEQMQRLTDEGRRGYMLSTKQVYNSLMEFNKHLDIYFTDIDVSWLRRYETHLRKTGIAENTIGIRFRKECYEQIKPIGINSPILVSQKGTVFTIQRINVILKEVKKRYKLRLSNFSCHSLRKTFGRQVYNMNSDNSELDLVKLMELFNHSSVTITKRYLGLRQEELLNTYDCLSF